ncbi:MAG: glutamate racemase [Hyphomicrobiales bacterium]
MKPQILIFDSGLGGLSIARAVRRALAGADITYAADNAAFPYGNLDDDELVARVSLVMEAMKRKVRPDVVVIACNTASTLALEALRRRFHFPFVGTVPAIKPAAALSDSGIIGVLATPGTVERDYTRALIQTYAHHRDVVLHGCGRLAAIAEAVLRGEEPCSSEISSEIAPAFVERDGKKTDVLVLGCTHYPLIADEIGKAAPWPVQLVDPSEAIARRVAHILDELDLPLFDEPSPGFAFLTNADDSHIHVLEREGFAETEILSIYSA